MRFRFQFIGLLLFVVAAVSGQAGEYAVLGNGFRLHADRHEVDGNSVLLYAEGGVTRLAAESIHHFEAEEAIAALPTIPAPPAPGEVPGAPVMARRAQTPAELAAAAAKKYSLPESFVLSVMKVESGMRQEAVSAKGARGLMQLMPETARLLGVDASDSRQNVEGGAQYLRELLARYENHPDQVVLALAAYNAGPGAVDKFHGVPPFRETREYILRVLTYWDRAR
jgi:soluble lytic murein transglycosylase-like protein